MTRGWIGVMAVAMAMAASNTDAQDNPDPQLEPLGDTVECSVLQSTHRETSCSSTAPRARWEDFDLKVYRAMRSTVSIWLRANVAMQRLDLEVVFRHTNDPYDDRERTYESNIAAGENWTESVYPDFTWGSHVDIHPAPAQGWE